MRSEPQPIRTAGGATGLERPDLAAIFLGGFLGSVVRAALAQSDPTGAGQWPWATFVVNILATFLLGCLIARLPEHPRGRGHRLSLLGIGLSGALSTFSTMMLELLQMIDGAHWTLAAGYATASLGGGLAALVLARKLVSRAKIVP